MDDNRRQRSASNSSTYLCPKPGHTDILFQMEPGDGNSSKYEDALLKEKILQVLSGTYNTSEVTIFYINQNFVYDPSNLSYYEDETEMGNNLYYETKNVLQKNEVVETRVSVTQFPREQYAEVVTLTKKKNILQRIWNFLLTKLGCRGGHQE